MWKFTNWLSSIVRSLYSIEQKKIYFICTQNFDRYIGFQSSPVHFFLSSFLVLYFLCVVALRVLMLDRCVFVWSARLSTNFHGTQNQRQTHWLKSTDGRSDHTNVPVKKNAHNWIAAASEWIVPSGACRNQQHFSLTHWSIQLVFRTDCGSPADPTSNTDF